MKLNRTFLLCIVVLLVLGAAACEKNLPAPTTAPGGPGEDVPPGVTPGLTDVIDVIYMQATQTALALATGVAPVEPTPEVFPTAEMTAVPEVFTPTAPVAPVVTPTAPVIVDVPPITVPATYTLEGGEFPYCIARRFNVDPGELLRLNGMSSYSIYYAGMALKIPQSGLPFPGNRSLRGHPTTYTVQTGDTLNKIACYFGDVAPEQIAYANGLTAPYRLTPGQVLNIP